MNILIALSCIILTIYGFSKKREYVLAIVLVGQPILKLMIKPFSSEGKSIFLIIYFLIGFFTLLIIKFKNGSMTFKFHPNYPSQKTIMLILLFFLSVICSVTYTPDKLYGMNKIFEFISGPILIVILTAVIINSEFHLFKTMKAIGMISFIIGVITILLVYSETGSLIARLGTVQAQEIQFLGINFVVSIWFGRRMGIAFFAMLFVTSIERNLMNYAVVCSLLILSLLSASRGPILSMILTSIIIIAINLNKKNINRKFYKRMFVIIIVAFIIFIASTVLNSESISNRLLTFKDVNAISRLNMYSLSIGLIKDNLLGYGVGSFYSLTGSSYGYPHNLFLEILLEEGIQGLAIFTLLLIVCFKYCTIMFKTESIYYYKPLANFAISTTLFALINSQFSGDITTNEYIWFGAILIGKLADIAKRRNASTTKQSFKAV